MSDTKLKTETIDGRKVDVYVTESGTFRALLDGSYQDSYSASSLQALMKQVREVVKGQTKEVPAAQVEWSDGRGYGSRGKAGLLVTKVVISGVHAGNNNILYRHEGQDRRNTQQGSRYGRESFLRRPTEEEIALVTELYKLQTAVERKIEAWHQSLVLDIEASLKKGEPVIKKAPGRD